MGDITDKKVTLTLRNAVLVAGGIVAAAAGYFHLDGKAQAGVEAKQGLKEMSCDMRQLKNFIIYKQVPHPLDTCTPGK